MLFCCFARDEETKEKKMPKTENEVEIPILYKASGGEWCVSIKLVELPGFQNTFWIQNPLRFGDTRMANGAKVKKEKKRT